MGVIFKILAGVAIVIVLLLVIALFVKNDYVIKRNILISRSKQDVFDYVKYLKNMDHYNKWVMMDQDMKKEFKGVDGTVGFVYAWDGNDRAGKGAQEIRTINNGEKVDIEIRFIKPFEGIAQTTITTESEGAGQTKVGWEMKGLSKYPMNLTNLFIDKMLGDDLTASLEMLKTNLEK